MAPSTSDAKPIRTFRLGRKVDDAVQRLAVRDEESVSAILRRLIKAGLRVEQRSASGDEAA